MHAPAERGSAECLEPVGELVVVRGRAPRTGGPHHDLALRPRRLQGDAVVLILVVGVVVEVVLVAGAGLARVEAVVHPAQPFELVGEVRDHLVAFGSGQPVDRLETALRIGEERVEDARRRTRVGIDEIGVLG